MKTINTYIGYKKPYQRLHLLMLGLVLILLGCTNDNSIVDSKSSTDITELSLNLSSQMNPHSLTRGGSKSGTIGLGQMQVLVFEILDDDNEVFSYKAEITKERVSSLVIKAKTSKPGQKFRFVVLANADSQTINENTAKKEALDKFTFSLMGKWNIDSTNPIPMWGESQAITVDREKDLGILLNVALAKADIGLNFKPQTQDSQTDEADGLENFKLKSARVYRTKHKAHVAGHSENSTSSLVGKPNIPTDALYNLASGTASAEILSADQDPLTYEVDFTKDPNGTKIANQILIPESNEVTDATTMDNTACIVIGGYFGKENIKSANPKETFYRIDFAQYNADSTIKNYKSILRNNRYVFNLRSVSGPGFPTPELALNSIPINISLDVQEWNMDPLDMKVQGEYFFSIENRFVTLPTINLDDKREQPQLTDQQKIDFKDFVWVKVGYDSNVPDKAEFLKWQSSGTNKSKYFELIVEDEFLWFGAKPNAPTPEDNTPKEPLKDVLSVKILDMEMDITVDQEALNLIYKIKCATVKVNGKYREDATLNYTHNIELTIVSPRDLKDVGMSSVESPYSLHGQNIHVYTEKRKGISFAFKGKLDDQHATESSVILDNGTSLNVREYKITLDGEGTPTRDPLDPNIGDSPKKGSPMRPIEDLRISTNSILDFGDESVGSISCTTRIIFGYKTKKLLTIGSNAGYRFGYVLEPNTASRALVDANINFGVDQGSAVTMEQFASDYPEVSARNNAFHVKVMTSGSGMDGYHINEAALRDNLNNFRPDIIVVGYATYFRNNDIELLNEYVDKGGVLIMNTEYYPNQSSVSNLLDKVLSISTNGGNRNLSQSEFRFRLPQGPEYKEDMILNGPFGDLRGKNWGTDGYSLFRVKNLPAKTTVYSSIGGDPCFFKYEGLRSNGQPKAFVFNGDGGFISNPKRYIGPNTKALYDYFPFAINDTYQPIPRENFLWNSSGASGYIYNSQLFANILTWAVDYAEQYGYNIDQ